MRMDRSRMASALLVVLLSCSGDPEPPTGPPPITGPGYLSLSFTTPNDDDGAVYFTLGGAPFDSLTSTHRLLTDNAETDQRRGIVAGDIDSGSIAIFWVPARENIASYAVTLEQVAVRQVYTQRSLQGYGLSIVQP